MCRSRPSLRSWYADVDTRPTPSPWLNTTPRRKEDHGDQSRYPTSSSTSPCSIRTFELLSTKSHPPPPERHIQPRSAHRTDTVSSNSSSNTGDQGTHVSFFRLLLLIAFPGGLTSVQPQRLRSSLCDTTSTRDGSPVLGHSTRRRCQYQLLSCSSAACG